MAEASKPILDPKWPYTRHKRSAKTIKETPHEDTVRLLNEMMQSQPQEEPAV